MMMLRHTMIVAAVALGVASCSTSDEATTQVSQPTSDSAPTTEQTDDPSTDAATTDEVATAPATEVPPTDEAPVDPASESDRDAAASALLSLGDYPEGWTEGPAPDDSDEEEFDLQASVAECLGVAVDEYPDFTDDESRAESGVFMSPEGASVQQQVVLVADVEVATDAMAQYAREDSPACYRDAVQEFFEAQLESNEDFSAALPPDATIGLVVGESSEVPVSDDTAVHYSLAVPIEFEGGGVTLFNEVLFFRQGRALSQIQIRTTEMPFGPENLGGLASTVLARLEAVAI
ncbi:MAG: hypothetical protein WA964_05175 [Ilumatobacter sp.]|uniref:hypothetical protein n=1 Tax=Ilumatobacter sp. TaxID=1967498 RepID=UPI003C723947